MRGRGFVLLVSARFVVAFALVGALVGCGSPDSSDHSSGAGGSLGTVSFPVSCKESVRGDFNHAAALLHHMTYPQARAAFAAVADEDPECAMAHWGIAMTLFQPLWPTRPGPDERKQAWQAVESARSLEPPTERERLFVEAAAAFFEDPAFDDYWARIRRWEAAMEALHEAFPDDPEASAFYALAHLAVAPADTASSGQSSKAADLLLGVYRENPDHPGAMHYIIHANDSPGRETLMQDIVRKYEEVAPDNPHALHMPTHIYTRLGDWNSVIRGNRRAAEAALQHPAGPNGEWVSDEFPHAIEYLVYAHLQQGADELALAELRRMEETESLQPSFKTAFHLASTAARYGLERGAWSEAASIEPRGASGLDWDRFKWPEGIAWFARGLGAVRQGDLDQGRRAAARLAELETGAIEDGENLFGRNLEVLRLELESWLAAGDGNLESALGLMQAAVELELATPKHAVTPGPTLPALEQLGDLLSEHERHGEALAAYERSLGHYPGRWNSRLGAARAAAAADEPSLASTHYRALLDSHDGVGRASVLDEARVYLEG